MNRVFCCEYYKIWFMGFWVFRFWFDGKLDNVLISLVFDCCFIWKKNIKDMLVIKMKKNYKKIFCVEFVVKLWMEVSNLECMKKVFKI